ncbi:hypothetical protein NC651_024741 [Populus alba x Populus x berolinensis]|nr:hypothetical protein NC651_024741 [Populus alba x Populus x berolinensis]
MKFNRSRNQRATTVHIIFRHINTGTDYCCIGTRPKKSLVQPLTGAICPSGGQQSSYE